MAEEESVGAGCCERRVSIGGAVEATPAGDSGRDWNYCNLHISHLGCTVQNFSVVDKEKCFQKGLIEAMHVSKLVR